MTNRLRSSRLSTTQTSGCGRPKTNNTLGENVQGIRDCGALAVTSAKPADAIESLLSTDDVARVLHGSRRTIERMRAAGKLPKPDLHLNRMPRWRPETIRAWIQGGRP